MEEKLMAKKDYTKLAQTIIENVGGQENIANVIHCITRLRFYLKDEGRLTMMFWRIRLGC